MLHNLAQRVRAGETLLGAWLTLNDVGVAEIVARSGFDFVVIDMEHGLAGFDNLRNLIMAVEHHAAPMIRAKANAAEFISTPLDIGAAGVIVPRVNTAEEARAAVRWSKYPPLGRRGIGPYRVGDYGDPKDVFARANEEQMLWVQIEHADAVANAEEIVAVPGIDLFFIGRGDLAASMGHIGDLDHPDVAAAAMRTLGIIRKAGRPAASAFPPTADLKPWHDAEMRVFACGADHRFVQTGAVQALAALRDNLPLT